MVSNQGFELYHTGNQLFAPLVRGEFKKMNTHQVKEFIQNVHSATSSPVEKIDSKVKVHFVDSSMELTLAEAKDLMHQLKQVTKVEPTMQQLFKNTLGRLKEISQSLEGHNLPYVGIKNGEQINKLLVQQQKYGVYLVAVPPLKDYSAPEGTLKTVKVAVSRNQNGKGSLPKHYNLDQREDGKYVLREKPEEVYPSISDFIEHKKTTGEFLEPLQLTKETAYSTVEATKEHVTQYAYFPDMTYDVAVSLIGPKPAGTYLICDRVKDRNGKVIVYKTANDEIRAEVLTLSCSEVQGYDCNGRWYRSLDHFMEEDRQSDTGSKFTIGYKKPVELVLAERESGKKSKSVRQEVTPTWKKDQFAAYRNALKENPEGAKELMKKACEDGEFEVMKWLAISHKTPLPSKETLTHEQKAQIEWLEKLKALPPTKADDAFLQYAALTVGYGYKAANLMVQDFHAENINKELKVASVDVPAKLLFSDFEMRQHLKPIMNDLEENWKKFLGTFSKEDIARFQSPNFDPVATPIQISSEGQIILDQMQNQISLHYRQTPFHSPEFEDWLQNNPSQFYIVRSTGREDTRENPNPGGNETIPNVVNDPLILSEAFGEVLKSYCGMKSVTQRLLVGDKSLFTDPLFFPVLVMKQVSEGINGEGSTPSSIPRSGVMLTGQAGKATGVTLMQVGLGACSGIVESKVAVDTYYVDERLAVHSIVREKNSRYVPTQASPSAPVRHMPISTEDAQLATAPALQDAVIQDLKRVADYFSRAYGANGALADMDVEFSITKDDQGNPRINLFQIRPFVEKQSLNPSYLQIEKLNALPEQNKIKVRTLLGAKAAVENLTSPSEAMFVDNLPQALSRYLKTISQNFAEPTARTAPPKVIFTRQASHLTSHEAIFFRNRGVVIVVVDDLATNEALQQLCAKASDAYPVKVCTQRGIVVDTHGIDASNLAVDGFARYPIPLEFSIPPNPLLGPISAIELGTRTFNIMNRFNALKEKLLGNESIILDEGISSLLDIAATSNDPVLAKRALATILEIMKKQLADNASGGRTLVKELSHLFDTAVKMVANSIAPALSGNLSDPEIHMNRLFHLKFLEALIGQSKQEGMAGASSWNQLVRASLREENASGKLPEHERATILKTIANLGINAGIRNEWPSFINSLADHKDSKYLGQAADLVAEMTRLGITATWMNLVFHDVASKGMAAEKVLEALIAIKEANNEQLLWAKGCLEKLKTARQEIGEWSNPEFAAKNIQTLRDLFTKDLEMIATQTPGFVKRLQESNQLGRLILLEIMRQAIDVYDKTIKAVTASADYPENNQLKTQHFTRLLIGYLRMLEGASASFTSNKENKPISLTDVVSYLEHGHSFHGNNKTQGLVGLLHSADDQATDFTALLQARPQFTTIPFIPGAEVDLGYGIVWPETAEELFTTIHQILEGIRRHQLAQTAQIGELLEGGVADVAKNIQNLTGQNISYFNMDGSKLELVFQIPLRQHSASLSLFVDAAHPENGFVLKGETCGAEEHNRWAQIATYGAFFSSLKEHKMTEQMPAINYEDPHGVTFTVELPNNIGQEGSYPLISKIMYLFKDLSMSHTIFQKNVVADLNKSLGGNWTEEKISSRFFSHCPYIAVALMNKFSQDGNKQLLIKACVGALESLITYGLNDYTVKNDSAADYFPLSLESDPRFEQAKVLKTYFGSLQFAATCYLLKMLDEEPELAKEYVQRLLANPEFRSKFADIAALLEVY